MTAPIPVTWMPSLEESVEMIFRLLNRGDVFIVYDEVTQTANIVPKEYAKSNSQEED